MSWKDILKSRARKKIKQRIQQMPEYEIVDEDQTRGHGGQIAFLEKEPHGGHENIHPHLLHIPSSPKNLDNYMRRMPAKMRSITRRGYKPKTGQFNYDDYLKR